MSSSAHLRLLSAAAASLPAPAATRFSPRRRVRLLQPLPALPLLPYSARALASLPRLSLVRRRCAVAVVEGQGEEEEGQRLGLEALADGEEVVAAAEGIWAQVRDVVVFAGPALGLWICGPLMSLIDTMVIGQTSSLQLAALGPGTVFCDYLCYIFMFLSVATSNMVATSLANKLLYAG